MKRRVLFALRLPLLLAPLGCASPEATRVRGGGAGADVGNRDAEVDVHGPIDVYHRTPLRGAGRGPGR